MAESLREFHIPIPDNITKDELRDICACYEILYNISLRTETEIKQKMLAKVDKARLISIDRDVQTAYDVQLQAIKDILEGK